MRREEIALMADWDELFRDPKHVLLRPDPLAEALAADLDPASRVLDLGSGGGRHLDTLAAAGHRATGLDISARGLQVGRDRSGGAAGLVRADFRAPLPFRDGAFDAVLSIKVLNHASPDDIRLAFAEVARVIRPGGRFYGVVISTRDARYGDGRPVGPDTFVHDRPPEEGVVHHYFRQEEVRSLLAGFQEVQLDLLERRIGPQEPIFGQYAFARGVDPVLRHWAFRARDRVSV